MDYFQSRDCEKCGGAMLIDTDKRIYLCPSCGMTYDYDYFADENLLRLAYGALTRGEFSTAKEVFSDLHKTDPHDLSALRGLLLCSMGIASFKMMDIAGTTVDPDDPQLLYCIEKADFRGREYFYHIQNTGTLSKEYVKNEEELSALRGKYSNVETEITTWNQLIRERRHRASDAIAAFVGGIIDINKHERFDAIEFVLFLLAGMIAGFVWLVYKFGWIVIAITAGLIAIGVILYTIWKISGVRKMKEKLSPIIKRRDDLNAKIDELESRNDLLREKYMNELKEAFAIEPDPKPDAR